MRKMRNKREIKLAMLVALCCMIMPINILTAKAEEFEWVEINSIDETVIDNWLVNKSEVENSAKSQTVESSNAVDNHSYIYIYSYNPDDEGYETVTGSSYNYSDGSWWGPSAFESVATSMIAVYKESVPHYHFFYAKAATSAPEEIIVPEAIVEIATDSADEATQISSSVISAPVYYEAKANMNNTDGAKLKVKISGGNATLDTLSKATMEAIVDSSKSTSANSSNTSKTQTKSFTIDAAIENQTVNSIQISSDNVKAIIDTVEENDISDITFKGTGFEMTMDKDLLSYYGNATATNNVRLVVNEDVADTSLNMSQRNSIADKDIATTFTAYIESNSARHINLPATVDLNLETNTDENDYSRYHLYHLDFDGNMTEVEMQYDGTSIEFTDNILGDFVVVYE